MKKLTQKFVHGAIALAILGNLSAIAPAILPNAQAGQALESNIEATALAAKTPFDEGKQRLTVPITAYSSTPDQTDDSPFITASGAHVRDGIVAANFLPFGTKIKIPELFGEKVFVVEDRMNRRFFDRLDIWMLTRSAAIKFGIKKAEIVVL